MIEGALVWTVWIVGIAVAGFLVFVGVEYLVRGNPLERIRVLGDRDALPSASAPEFGRLVATSVNTQLQSGNRIEILFNGEEVYPRLFEDLRSAETLITWQVFWFKPGELADELHGILSERARAGVQVLLLYDWFGALGVDDEYWESLEAAGCEVRTFRPPRWNALYKWQKRSHTRTVIVDGRTGYTGGFAIHDDWRGDGKRPGQWRDTSVRMEGRIVHRLQTAFISAWIEATGELLLGKRLLPHDIDESGPHSAGLLFNTPSVGSTDAGRYLALSIDGARDTLWITSAYFVPDDDFRHLMIEAVERGVDVRILTPGDNNDRKSTWYAARCHYEELLEGGVRIWEYEPTMVHAKTLVADGTWCAVGTINFDNRSLSLNEEVGVLAQDDGLGCRLQRRFLEDLEHAREIDLDAFRSRGALDRARERFWVLFSRVL